MQIIRSRTYLGNQSRGHGKVEDDWFRKMKALTDPQPINQSEDPQEQQTLDASDLAWVEKMLALAEDTPEEQEHRETEYQSDEALIQDFIHNKGIFTK